MKVHSFPNKNTNQNRLRFGEICQDIAVYKDASIKIIKSFNMFNSKQSNLHYIKFVRKSALSKQYLSISLKGVDNFNVLGIHMYINTLDC